MNSFTYTVVSVGDEKVIRAFTANGSVNAVQRSFTVALDPRKALEAIRGFAVVVEAEQAPRGAFIFEEIPGTETWNVHCAMKTFGSRTSTAFLGVLDEARRHGARQFCAFFSSSNRTVKRLLERNGFFNHPTEVNPEWSDTPWIFVPFS